MRENERLPMGHATITGGTTYAAEDLPQSMATEERPEEKLPTLSREQSQISEMIESPSMSLLDESANYIFDLMKGLSAGLPHPEIRSYDPDRVNSAVACANSIYKIMRLKLDAIRLQAKLRGDLD